MTAAEVAGSRYLGSRTHQEHPGDTNFRAFRLDVCKVMAMELWTTKQAATYWQVSASRARSILRSRGVPHGYPADTIREIAPQQGQRTDLTSLHDAIRKRFHDQYNVTGDEDLVIAAERLLLRSAKDHTVPAALNIPPTSRSVLISGMTGTGKTETAKSFLRRVPHASATVFTSHHYGYADLPRVQTIADIDTFVTIVEQLQSNLRTRRPEGRGSEPHRVYIVEDLTPRPEVHRALDTLLQLTNSYPDEPITVLTTTSEPRDTDPSRYQVLVALNSRSSYHWLTGTDPRHQNVVLEVLGRPESLMLEERHVLERFAPNSPERRQLAANMLRAFDPPLGAGVIRLENGSVHPLADNDHKFG